MPDIQIPEQWTQWLKKTEFLGNSVGQWLGAAAVFVAVLIVLRILKAVLAHRAARLAEKTESHWDDTVLETLQRTKWWFLIVLALYGGSQVLAFSDEARSIVQTVAILTLILQAAFWGNVLITKGVERHVKRKADDDPASAMTISMLAFLGKLVLFSLLVLLALDNVGVDVTALIAGLGVGGIAVALAVQNVLGDLLGSLSIVFDKPFVPGDFIIVGDDMGTVEKIGLKTTRVRSLSGEQLVFANSDLLKSRVRNYKRMQERRIVFTVGATYQTPRHTLEQLPSVLGEIVQSQQQVRFDRAHFKAFGDSSLIYEIVYHVLTPDYNLYMDIQQAINFAICERFEQMNVEFAYPTRTIFLENTPPQASS